MLLSVEEFAGQIGALRELNGLVQHHAEPLDRADFERRIDAATAAGAEGLDHSTRERIARAGLELMRVLDEVPRDEFAISLGLPVASSAGREQLDLAQKHFASLLAAYPDLEHRAAFLFNFTEALMATPRVETMNRAVIVAGVSALEPLVRRLFVAHRRRERPSEAPEATVRATRLLLAKGYQGWDSWCLEHFGFTLTGESLDPTALIEVFERRHLLVHSAGLADDQYVAKTGAAVSLGTALATSSEYTLAALELIAASGLRFAHRAWSEIDSALASDAAVLMDYTTVRHLLRASAWGAAASVCAALSERATTSVLRDRARIHCWYARKRLEGLAAVQEAIEVWAAPSADFELARLALLDRRMDAIKLARELLASGVMTRVDFTGSPVLDWLTDEV